MNRLPVRALTRGPKHHWFGYYDKQGFDSTGRYVLGMEVEFENRSPRPDDEISIGMIDLQDGDRWIELGRSTAWCWQQGCMLQWRPGIERQVLWNDRQEDGFVCQVLDVETGVRRTLPGPVYTVSPDGMTAFSTDFSRLNHLRPGYGYAGIADPNEHRFAPEDTGIWRMDMESGERELIVSVADIAATSCPDGDTSRAMHYFNHLLVNPDGTRLEFLHRRRPEGSAERVTRMLTCAPDGRDIRVVDDCGVTSHFIWHDTAHILAWSCAHSSRGDFCMFDERTGESEPVGTRLMTEDGHVNCLPGAEWLMNDTYPDANRVRTLYVYHMRRGERVDIGTFLSPRPYDGEWRCDLHPRLSPDGRRVSIDSVHEGHGRQIYLIDLNEVIGG